MAEMRDIVRITPLNKSIEGELPDVDDPEALKVAAERVHSFLHTKITPVSTFRKLDGRPGREWQGRILTEVIYRLWPRLIDRVLVTDEEARARSGALLDYMVRCGIIFCVRKTYQDVPAKWWVSDNFTPVTVTQMEIEPDAGESTEETPEENVEEMVTNSSEGSGELVCREPECGASFTQGQARSGHEFNLHKMVARPDGVRFYITDPDFNAQYVVNSIVEVLKEAGKPLTFYGVWDSAFKKDPRLGKSILRDHLGEMVNVGVVSQVEQGRFTYFELATEQTAPGPIQGLLETIYEARRKQAGEKEAATTWTAPIPTNLNTGIAYAQHVMSTAMGNIKTVQEAIDALVQYAAAKEQEIAKLRIQLTASPKESDEVKRLTERLTEVEAERDRYKSKVELFDRALEGLRTK